MKESVGTSFNIQYVAIFIVIVVFFLCGTLLYMKAYKVNNSIKDSIEKFEGYNGLARDEITDRLLTLGYARDNNRTLENRNCPTRYGVNQADDIFDYCVYELEERNGYYRYGVLTYIRLDVPIINQLVRLPVYSITERIYNFG